MLHNVSTPALDFTIDAKHTLHAINDEMRARLLAQAEVLSRHAGHVASIDPALHDKLLREVRELNALALGGIQ